MPIMSAAVRPVRAVAIAAAFLAAPRATLAASFDCARAATAMEHLVCADAALGARDEIMARLYAAARRQDGGGRVAASQREWLATAGACTTVACLAGAYDRRNARLLRSEGGGAAATDYFTEEPKGNHGTLSVVGPVHGFASVALTSTYVGAGGEAAGDVYAAGTDAFLDLRHGPAVTTRDGCTLTVRPLAGDRWEIAQAGACDLPGGTVYAGTYARRSGSASLRGPGRSSRPH